MASFTQTLQCSKISGNQAGLLLAAPAFDLTFSRQGFILSVECLGVNQHDGTSSRRIASGEAGVVKGGAGFEVVGMADVERIVGATQDVEEEHRVPLDLLRSLGTPLD